MIITAKVLISNPRSSQTCLIKNPDFSIFAINEFAIAMKGLKTLVLIIAASFLSMSAYAPGTDFLKGRYNNVCKDLINDVLLYFVFIDTRTTSAWTEFDILTTIDSIQEAAHWLEAKAVKNNIELNIKTDYYIGDVYATVEKNLPGSSIREIIENQKLDRGLSSINRWGDYIARIIGESVYIKDKDGIPEQKKPVNKERLIAFLRDEYNVESVALVFMLNNYYRNDISIAVNTYNNDDVEFCIVSYKYPSEIAHTFLNLFGAADLYETPFRKSRKKIRLAEEYYPLDIMQDPYAKKINDLDIGDFTKYMIGWTDDLPDEAVPLLTDRAF